MDTMTFTPAHTAPATTAAPPPTSVRPDEVPANRPPGDPGRLGRLWRGPEGDPMWARPALFGLLLGTAILYFSNLTSSGYANSFYSAAVQAGSASWKAFFYGSSDAANSITVDKPTCPSAATWRGSSPAGTTSAPRGSSTARAASTPTR
ncbi:MAG: hypothetical protein ABI131_06970, partial [Nostocoides sp.]